MEQAGLARKQKRIKDWLDFIQGGGVQDPQLRSQVLQAIEAYKRILAKCWQAKATTPSEEVEILDLERKLEELNEQSRMTIVGKRGGLPTRIVW